MLGSCNNMTESEFFDIDGYTARLEAEQKIRFNEAMAVLRKADAEYKTRITDPDSPESIEALVADGRRPLFVDFVAGTGIGQEARVMCFIPPEGTQYGEYLAWLVGGPQFSSPGGIERGFAATLEFTPEEAMPLMERAKAALSTPPLV